ncbi:hypothetical protein ALC62_03925 [Cyphomyrmex costatus]|uniref:Uncharacterized protein n=1 Tax=Cyphomyrmex costatus TaxID=456900 RepID=A0A195CWU8_9HYME|nr:hypothetical protein ALC62_03925 [Cyphomyrmex costatus]
MTRLQQQHQDVTETESKNSRSTSSSTTDSFRFFTSCNSNYTEYDYKRSKIKRQSEKRKRAKRPLITSKPYITVFTDIKNTKSLKINKTSNKPVAKSKIELSKDYCPYSSDNCGCSSGCMVCDYGLYTYTTKNRSKLKSKNDKFYVSSSSNFRSLVSERNQKAIKSSGDINILSNKKRKLPKKKALKSCSPQSSDSCNHQSNYIKRDLELQITKNQKPTTKKKTSMRTFRKLQTTKIVVTLKLCKKKKIFKDAAENVSQKNVIKNWSLDSTNNYESNSDYTDYEKRINKTKKKKKLKNKSRGVKNLTKLKMSEFQSSIIDKSVKNEKNSKQTARVRPKSTSKDYLEFNFLWII